MYVQVKSSNGITIVPIETRLMANRKLFIEGEITPESAVEFAKEIMLLNSEDAKAPIDVFVNSEGGEINSGLLMYDVIQNSEAPIRMYCIGKTYSMAAILVASGSHGRYILPHGEMMIHEPRLSSGVSGSSSSIMSISETLLATKEKLNRILAKHTGRTEEEIAAATQFDNFMSPEESVEFGLCDKIITFDMADQDQA